MTQARSDKTLLQLYTEGDKAAFGEFFDMHSQAVYAAAFAMLRSQTKAEDVAQEVFAHAAQTAQSLAQVEQVLPYLLRIARNKAVDMLRKTKRETALDETLCLRLKSREEAASAEAPEGLRKVQSALFELPQEQRETVILHLFKNLTFEQIAQATEESINTVLYRYYAALRKLKEKLHGFEL